MDLKHLLPYYSNKRDSNFEYTFTVFTSVYNRATTVKRVFNSLNKQTFKDFELIIIDDGSVDDTEKIIKNNFRDSRITYIKQKNVQIYI